MLTENEYTEFYGYIKDILDNKEFSSLQKEKHHNTTRYDHSLRVAILAYKEGKTLGGYSMKELVRGALLYDFYKSEYLGNISSRKALSYHPEIALENAKKYFKLTNIEENIIISHMFPLTKIKPNCKEAWLVQECDKAVAIYEFVKYRVPEVISRFS